MNSIIITCFGILCFVHFGQSALSYLPNAVDEAHPGKCVDKRDGIIMNPGETITVRKTCTRVQCDKSYTMDFATCGSVGYPKGCHLSGIDETKDYPDCCPKIVCSSHY